jgi:ferrous iron transport protein A
MLRSSEPVQAEQTCRLSDLALGQSAQIVRLQLEGIERRRLLDLGLSPGTMIEARLKSPLGDPVAYHVRGTTIALRRHQADKIEVTLCKS